MMIKILKFHNRIWRIISKMWKYFIIQILNLNIVETSNFNGLLLSINRLETGGEAYFKSETYSEVVNPFYQAIQNNYNPDIVLDIGANYGFTSILYASIFKDANIVAVEPSRKLCKYIKKNIENNKLQNVLVKRAICDSKEGIKKEFSNPLYSQDNRVKGSSFLWKKEVVDTTSIDSIFKTYPVEKFAYIKIDTQGFEKFVFQGGEGYLLNNNNWLIKTEFCPDALIKQGVEPKELLNYLIDKYDVVDFPGHVCFNDKFVLDSFKHKITKKDINSFINYVISLDTSKIGWTELLVKNKMLK